MANAEYHVRWHLKLLQTSQTIASELMRLPLLYEMDVTVTDASSGDEGCECGQSWQVRPSAFAISFFSWDACRLSTNHESFVFSRSVFSDSFVQCVWEVTFESKSGHVHDIEVAKAKSGSDCFSMLATLNSVNKVTDTDNIMTGTTIPISCNFRLQFDGEATGYMHEMKTARFVLNLCRIQPSGSILVLICTLYLTIYTTMVFQ